MSFIEQVQARAAALRRRIIFPESADPRTREAAAELAARGICTPVLVLDPAEPGSHAAVAALGLETLDPSDPSIHRDVAALLMERRSARGLSRSDADRLAATPLYAADAFVRMGRVDGCVAGAVHTTAEVLRAALWCVGPAPGVRTVSSAFYMVVPPFRGGDTPEVLTFTDCAVVPYPDAGQLADIAMAAAADRPRIVGDTPVVALLSFSTRGSGPGPSVDMVRDALGRIRAAAPGLAVDGELQGDAALASAVGDRKAPGSQVAGRANVLVFPSLDAGNIGYKLVQRLAGARAIGPVVQGLDRPCSDLSRGAAVDDIITVAAITALQAQGHGQPRSSESRKEMSA
jgi:phosphate acetyltransferase